MQLSVKIPVIRVVSILCAALLVTVSPANAQDRFAFIIGNSEYDAAPLANPINDASSIAEIAARLGFATEVIYNADEATMQSAFEQAIDSATGADLALFYFAGHGVQIDSINYLIPVDASLNSVEEIISSSVPLNLIVDAIAKSDIKTGIVFLDACRDNPAASKGVVESGLAFIEQSGSEMVISYAAAAGSVAFDGTGGNHSPYSTALVEALEQPGQDIYKIMRQIRGRVRSITNGRQIPWVTGSVEREIVLNKQTALAFRETAHFDPNDPNWLDDTHWTTIVERSSTNLLERFTEDFPTSRYIPAARRRIDQLGQSRTPQSVTDSSVDKPQSTQLELLEPLAKSITECDRLASSPYDPTRVAPGVPLYQLDARKAILACTRDLSKGGSNPRLLSQLARALNLAERYNEALNYASLAGEYNYPSAIALLGWMHAEGRGMDSDPSRAVTLWRHAANLGDPNARANLARSYRDAFSVDRSIPDALHWFRLAARSGEMIAADDLGNMYRKGEIVERNIEQALDWYHLGAALGSSNAMTNLGSVYRDGDGLEKNRDIATHWYRRSIDMGNRWAPFHLARMLIEDESNGDEALELFMLAGNRGFAEGFSRAARMHLEGRGIDKDAEQAFYLATLGVASGDERLGPEIIETLEGDLSSESIARITDKANLWMVQNSQNIEIAKFAK